MDGTNYAIKMKDNSYSPYSNFRVGACLEFLDGTLIGGCNIENASYGLTICAERVAVSNAIAQGKDLQSATTLYIATDSQTFTPPCGACLQVLVEFFTDLKVVLINSNETTQFTLNELLPHNFSKDNLN